MNNNKVNENEELKANENKCVDCRACHKVCPMMHTYSDSPKDLLRDMMDNVSFSKEVAYSCMLCNACTDSCHMNIDLKDMFLNIRTATFKEKGNQMPMKRRLGIKKVENHQAFSFSPIFSSKGIIKDARSLFIPGCSLTNYNLKVLENTYHYLKETLEDVDMIVQCCGKPSMYIGDEGSFVSQIRKIQKMVDDNHIEQIVVACENCYNTYKNNLKNVNVITLWELIAELGVPSALVNHYNSEKVYALHDPCSIKNEPTIHEAVRGILKEVGIEIVEFEYNREKAACCGSGGMVRETDRQLWEAQRIKRACATEATYIISYCQCCVSSLAVGGKKTLHVLDLLFNDGIMKSNIDCQKNISFASAWCNKCMSAHCMK